MRTIATLFAVSLCSLPAAAQGIVHFVPGEGGNVFSAGDFDHDGVNDFAICVWDQVWVRSGADASLILNLPQGTAYGAVFGPDLDHDGTPDLVLGNVGDLDPSGAGTGSATAYSGATGSMLWKAYGAANTDAFGFVLGKAGDADADGTPDVLVEAWQYNPPFGGGPGYVRLLSGVDGGVLHEWAGAVGYASFGLALGTIGDYDGDGHDDSLVTELAVNGGVIHLYSGADGSLIKVFDPPVDGAFGMHFTSERDIDGDGVRDLAVAAPSWGDWSGRVVALSGADGSLLVDVQGTQPYGTYLGGDVEVIDDVNGDGVPEVLTGGLDLDSLTGELGFGLVVSGADSSILLAMPLSGVGSGPSGSPLAALGDLDGDGVPEFASSSADTFVFTLATPTVESFCPAKTNSQGCVPMLVSSGVPSLVGPDSFRLACGDLIHQVRGALMVSGGASSPPYQGGTLCLAPPWKPALAFVTGGTGSGSGFDCSGSVDLDLGAALLQATGLSAGDMLHAQLFYRDPMQPDGTGLGLSDGVRIALMP